jgi:hypothetical protein
MIILIHSLWTLRRNNIEEMNNAKWKFPENEKDIINKMFKYFFEFLNTPSLLL